VGNVLELLPGGGNRETDSGKFLAPQLAVRSDHLVSEGASNLLQSGPARLDDFPGEDVGVDDRDGAFAQQIPGGGFTHANTASESKDFHASSWQRLQSSAGLRVRNPARPRAPAQGETTAR
jgi:hypothetical protein